MTLHDDPRLTAFALGELPADERAQIAAAVAADPALAAEVEAVRAAARALASGLAQAQTGPELPADFADGLLAQLRAEEAAAAPAKVLGFPAWARWAAPLAVAAALVASVGLLLVSPAPPAETAPPPPLADLPAAPPKTELASAPEPAPAPDEPPADLFELSLPAPEPRRVAIAPAAPPVPGEVANLGRQAMAEALARTQADADAIARAADPNEPGNAVLSFGGERAVVAAAPPPPVDRGEFRAAATQNAGEIAELALVGPDFGDAPVSGYVASTLRDEAAEPDAATVAAAPPGGMARATRNVAVASASPAPAAPPAAAGLAIADEERPRSRANTLGGMLGAALSSALAPGLESADRGGVAVASAEKAVSIETAGARTRLPQMPLGGPFEKPVADLKLALEPSTASYDAFVRRVGEDLPPDRGDVRPEQFANAFAPAPKRAASLRATAIAAPWDPARRVVVFAYNLPKGSPDNTFARLTALAGGLRWRVLGAWPEFRWSPPAFASARREAETGFVLVELAGENGPANLGTPVRLSFLGGELASADPAETADLAHGEDAAEARWVAAVTAWAMHLGNQPGRPYGSLREALGALEEAAAGLPRRPAKVEEFLGLARRAGTLLGE